jgi:hypothetical protein
MTTRDDFSASYAAARRAFLDAASAAGARLSSHANPLARGTAGEELATDVAWLGPADASRVLVTISGTHGAEGFAGAGIQVGSFRICPRVDEPARDAAGGAERPVFAADKYSKQLRQINSQ